MGMINHNAVLATCCIDSEFDKAAAWVAALPDADRARFIVAAAVMNHYQTIILPPDGSKERWKESDDGDRLRAAFIAMLKSLEYSDGSNAFDWIEIGYGEFGATIDQTNCVNRY